MQRQERCRRFPAPPLELPQQRTQRLPRVTIGMRTVNQVVNHHKFRELTVQFHERIHLKLNISEGWCGLETPADVLRLGEYLCCPFGVTHHGFHLGLVHVGDHGCETQRHRVFVRVGAEVQGGSLCLQCPMQGEGGLAGPRGATQHRDFSTTQVNLACRQGLVHVGQGGCDLAARLDGTVEATHQRATPPGSGRR